MSHKRRSTGNSERDAKRQREESPAATSARAAHALTLLHQTQQSMLETVECSKLARLVSPLNSQPLAQRAAEVMKLLQEDGKRKQPLLNLGYQLASGGLLLSEFIRFLAIYVVLPDNEPADKKQQREAASNVLGQGNNIAHVNALLRRSSPAPLQQHPENRDALALFTKLMVPTYNYGCNHNFLLDWARALLQRGADVNARDSEGYTPVQNWCSSANVMSAKDILMLLETGADFDAAHPHGWTALYSLCYYSRLQVLRELTEPGWLAVAHINLVGVEGKTPIALLQQALRDKPDDGDVMEMLELLSGNMQLWHISVRHALLAQLGIHDQLIPDLVELIVSFIDGGKADIQPVAAAAADS